MRPSQNPTCFLFPTIALVFAISLCQLEEVIGQKQLPVSTVENLESLIRNVVKETPLPGCAIAIVADDKKVYSKGFGYADVEAKNEIDASDTIFQIGSISKSFTATLAAQLVDEKKITWNDKLSLFLPNSKVPESPITLLHLAQHTSGLPGDPPNLRRKHGDYPVLAFTHFELYLGLAKSKLRFKPGSRWSYSNFGYAVLGHALEKRTNTPYETLVNKRLFEPLKMKSSTVTVWPEFKNRLAKPYHLNEGELAEYDCPWDQEALSPAGGISATVNDLAKYMMFQIRASKSDDNEIGQLQNPSIEAGSSRYGKGWFVEQIPGLGKVVSVGGDVDGYVGEIVFAPKQGIGCVILINSGDAPALPYLGRWILTKLVMKKQLGPIALENHYYRGMIAQSLKNWSIAMKSFSKANDQPSPHLMSLYQIGRTAAISGLYSEKGKSALQKYLGNEPVKGISHAAAYWRLGMIHANSGQTQLAIDAYNKSIDADPDLTPAKSALRKLLKKR